MDGVPPALVHLLWIVPLVLLILFLVSPRFRGDIAGTRVRRLLAQGLDSRHYSQFNSLHLPVGGGSTTIDHLVVSKFGVFVIASQYARGDVAGGEYQDRWKQQYLGKTTRFDNPLHQVRMQAEALHRLLGFPESRIKPILVLCGHASFRGGLLPGMSLPEQLIPRLRKFGEHVLTEEQVQGALKRLREAEMPPAKGVFVDVWAVLRWLLLAALILGASIAFKDRVFSLLGTQDAEVQTEQKTEQQLWEESLRCAWSSDAQRCACYSPDGKRAELSLSECRRLAEKGSILKQ